MEPTSKNAFIGYENFDPQDLRPYQLEMLDESLRGNVIVSMDTGTGKTGVAIVRARIALEKCPPDSRVWVLTPTNHLCEQQSKAFSKGLLMYACRSLCGIDGVDFWSDQRVWDSALLNMRVVVSTPDVLYNALGHGFVKFESIRLLIFDEAHHATGKNHVYHRIMAHHYVKAKRENSLFLPSILGLTASPSMSLKILPTFKLLEERLDSKIVTPSHARKSLSSFSVRTPLTRVTYRTLIRPPPESVSRLQELVDNYDFGQDPYVRDLMARSDSPVTVLASWGTKKTDSYNQLKALLRDALHLYFQLGPSSCIQYIERVKDSYRECAKLGVVEHGVCLEERRWMIKLLTDAFPTRSSLLTDFPDPNELSDKVTVLLEQLGRIWRPDFRGIVFVQQRSTSVALSNILRTHPLTKDKFITAPIFGADIHGGARNRIGYDGVHKHKDTLALFRTGQINLLIATAVLEEGIDVPDCSSVICFDLPPNPPSYIQRRGRARMRNSTCILLEPEQEDGIAVPLTTDWEAFDTVVEKEIAEKQRLKVENKVDDTIQWGLRTLEDPTTGAVMNRDRALPSMFYFFSNLISGPQRVFPVIVVTEHKTEKSFTYSAKVTLPASCPLQEREVSGGVFTSKKKARMDASFNVMSLLYKNGYLNGHFLPPYTRTITVRNRRLSKRLYCTARPHIPWVRNPSPATYFRVEVAIKSSVKSLNLPSVQLLMPQKIDLPRKPTSIFFSKSISFSFSYVSLDACLVSEKKLERLQRLTFALLDLARPVLTSDRTDFGLLLDVQDNVREPPTIENSLISFAEAKEKGITTPWVVVRDSMKQRYLVNLESRTKTVLGYLIPSFKGINYRSLYDVSSLAATKSLKLEECYFETLHLNQTLISLVYPRLVMQIEEENRVNTLQRILSDQGIKVDFDKLRTALTLPRANRKDPSGQNEENYQLLEYWGDRVLKLMNTIALASEYPTQAEGYLTGVLSCQLSNNVLASRALQLGLDQFLIQAPIHYSKWAPPYLSDRSFTNLHPRVLRKMKKPESNGKTQLEKDKLRGLSTKVLADVLEALIGAAYDSGGTESAWNLIRWIYPRWRSSSWKSVVSRLAESRRPIVWQPDPKLTKMIGYEFKRPWLLLEATTSPALVTPSSDDLGTRGYDVMELVGDAVLDSIVVSEILRFMSARGKKRNFGEGKFTQIQSAVINADFLAFCVLGLKASEEQGGNPEQDGSKEYTPAELQIRNVYLWNFLRYHDLEFGSTQARSFEKFKEIENEVREQIFPRAIGGVQADNQGPATFPWHALSAAAFGKPLSDMFESVTGAIFLDSGGDSNACIPFLETAGVLPVLRRILEAGIDTLHPLNRLHMIIKPLEVATKQQESADGEPDYTFLTTISAGGQILVADVAAPATISSQTLAASLVLARIQSGELDMKQFAEKTSKKGVRILFDQIPYTSQGDDGNCVGNDKREASETGDHMEVKEAAGRLDSTRQDEHGDKSKNIKGLAEDYEIESGSRTAAESSSAEDQNQDEMTKECISDLSRQPATPSESETQSCVGDQDGHSESQDESGNPSQEAVDGEGGLPAKKKKKRKKKKPDSDSIQVMGAWDVPTDGSRPKTALMSSLLSLKLMGIEDNRYDSGEVLVLDSPVSPPSSADKRVLDESVRPPDISTEPPSKKQKTETSSSKERLCSSSGNPTPQAGFPARFPSRQSRGFTSRACDANSFEWADDTIGIEIFEDMVESIEEAWANVTDEIVAEMVEPDATESVEDLAAEDLTPGSLGTIDDGFFDEAAQFARVTQSPSLTTAQYLNLDGPTSWAVSSAALEPGDDLTSQSSLPQKDSFFVSTAGLLHPDPGSNMASPSASLSESSVLSYDLPISSFAFPQITPFRTPSFSQESDTVSPLDILQSSSPALSSPQLQSFDSPPGSLSQSESLPISPPEPAFSLRYSSSSPSSDFVTRSMPAITTSFVRAEEVVVTETTALWTETPEATLLERSPSLSFSSSPDERPVALPFIPPFRGSALYFDDEF